MRNALIELNNYVAYKAAAAVVLLIDSSDVARTLKALNTHLRSK